MGIDYYLGIDWGEKRIGLAIGDSLTRLALPLATVSNLVELIEVIKKEGASYLVVGQPQKMSGEEANYQPWHSFITELKEQVKLEIIFQDERLTSLAADALVGRKKEKASQDEIAATLILQSYFDQLS